MDALADAVIAILVFATLATAWNWLGGFGGIVSFGHAVFFGLGGYGVAVSNLRGGSPWYGALGGALAAVLVAGLGGLVSLRGRGVVFSAITLAGALLAEPLVAAHAWLGPANVYRFPVRLGFLNLQFAQEWPYIACIAVVFGVALALTFGLRAARIGYALRALDADPAAARAIGVAALPPRLIALVVSAFFTAVVGAFCAEYAHGVTPHAMFGIGLGFDIALIGIIAGPATVWGAPLAGLVYALVTRVAPLHPPGLAGVAVLAVEALIVVVLARARQSGALRGRRRSLRPRVA